MIIKKINGIGGIILILFGLLTIMTTTGYSISVCDTLQPNSMCMKKTENRQWQLIEDSAKNDWFNELSASEGFHNIFVDSGSLHTRRKRFVLPVLAGYLFNLFNRKNSHEKPNQENPGLLEMNSIIRICQFSIKDNLEDIFDMNAQLIRKQKNLGIYVTGMDTKLNSIQNSLGIIKLSQDSNNQAMTGQLQNVQKDLDSMKEMNEKLNSNQYSLDDYIRNIVNSKIDNIQKSLGDYMMGVNGTLNVMQNSLEDIKDINAQLSRNQKNLGIYVTGMDAKLNSILNSLENITLINEKLDKIANSQDSNNKAMTGQLQNVQKDLDSMKEMNEKLNSNQKSLDDYVRGIVNSKIESIQKSLGDYMEGVNEKLDMIHKSQEENRKAIDKQLENIQYGVKDLKDRIQVHFKDLDDNMKKNFENLKDDIAKAFEVQKKLLAINQMKTEFFKYERIIEDSLRYSISYRKTNSATSKEAFLNVGKELESAINAILDGLLGGSIFGSDILDAIRIGKSNHGNNFIQAYEDIRDLLGVAAGVLTIYYRTFNADQAHVDLRLDEMEEKENRVINRVREIELDCRTEGQNVVEDIKKIMKTYANETSYQVGGRVYNYLSDKYSTSLWYVIANYPWTEKEVPVYSKNNNTRRYEVFDFHGKNVVAYSFDQNDMAMSNFDGCMNQLRYLYWHINVQNPPTFNEWRNDRSTNRNENCKDAKEIHGRFRNIDEKTDFIVEVIAHENPFPNSQNWRHPKNCDFWKRVYCYSKTSSKPYFYDIYIFPGGKSTRKYFKIVSQLDGMVVEASTLSSKLPGGPVHMKPDSNGAHQFWYLEPKSQTIRAMQTDLCLTSNGSDQVYLNWCDTSPSDQQLWRLKKNNTIVSWANPTQCLQVQEYSNANTPRLTERNCTAGDLNQKFTIKY